MQIGTTKKLQDYLKKEILPADNTIDPFFSWSASLVIINRRKAMVVMNDYSRCGFILYGLKAKILKDLESIIFDSIRLTLEMESIAPELIQRYMEDCGHSITYTKTKDRTSVARLSKFCQRVAFWAEEYVPDMVFQKHLIRRFNDDLFMVSGKYVEPVKMLEKGFREHYHVDQVFQYQMLNLNVKLLLDVPCYRRIRIPLNFSLDELHRVIQKLFYWQNYHLHEFQSEMGMPLDILFPEYSFLVKDDEYGCMDCSKIENVVSLEEVFAKYPCLHYIYDMGDCWEHEITYDGIDTGCDSGIPCCILAEGTAPPEDVGGIDGYAELKRIMNDPKDEEYKEMKCWADSMGWKPLDLEEINRKLALVF